MNTLFLWKKYMMKGVIKGKICHQGYWFTGLGMGLCMHRKPIPKIPQKVVFLCPKTKNLTQTLECMNKVLFECKPKRANFLTGFSKGFERKSKVKKFQLISIRVSKKFFNFSSPNIMTTDGFRPLMVFFHKICKNSF